MGACCGKEPEPTPPPAAMMHRKRESLAGQGGIKPDDVKVDLEKLPKIEKSDETIARIKACIGKNVLCSKLSDKYTEALVNAMKEITAKQGESVIKQGELGDYWFVAESGALEVFKTGDGETEGKKVNSYKPGDSFGELALMFNQRRAASVVATEDVVLWAVDQATFRALVLTAATENKTKYD